MIAPAMRMEVVLASLRRFYRQRSLPAVAIPGALPPAAAASLRERIEGAGFESFFLADRGRFHFNDRFVDRDLFSELAGLASQLSERSLEVKRARWLRLRHRDYALFKGDDGALGEPGQHELTLDFSSGSAMTPEIVYSDGDPQPFAAPQIAGSVVLVERRSGVFRCERYLDHRLGEAAVYRLRLQLHPG